MMKIVYCRFNTACYSDPFEKSQGHKMNKKSCKKYLCGIDVANFLFQCYLFKEMG